MALRPDSLVRPPPPPPEPDRAGLHGDLVAGDEKFLTPQIPCLMLPDDPDNEYHRQIYSLSKEDVLTKNLYAPELYDRRCFGLNYGWVLTVTRLGGEMNLVHPITRTQIELPPHTSIEGGYRDKETWPSFVFFRSVALRGNPSESSDFMVMAIHATGNYVYYWKPECKHWIWVNGAVGIPTVTCYEDQFYAVKFDGEVLVFKDDHDGFGSVVPQVIGKVNSTKLTYCPDVPYIVGSTRGLLVVLRESYLEDEGGEGFRGVAPRTSRSQEVDVHEVEGEDVPDDDLPEDVPDEEMEWEDWRYGLVKFHVFELDLINGGHNEIKDLGDRAIFVGQNMSICFDHASELSGIKPNHIYFTDDYYEMYSHLFKGGGRDMGVYSLEDGRITQFKIDESSRRSRICPPFWFIPSS